MAHGACHFLTERGFYRARRCQAEQTEGVLSINRQRPLNQRLTRQMQARHRIAMQMRSQTSFADKVAHDPLIIISEPAAEEGHAPAVYGVFGNEDAEADLIARL